MESQMLLGRNCAIELNKLSSISLFINQLLLYELLMTDYSRATQWAVQISSAQINLASAALLVGRTSKRSTQLGRSVQIWSTFILFFLLLMSKLGDFAMSNILKWGYLQNRNVTLCDSCIMKNEGFKPTYTAPLYFIHYLNIINVKYALKGKIEN